MVGYVGVDYGLGLSNINNKTGIRYGVISQHTVGQAWYEDAEPDYGKPTCPKCGREVSEFESYTGAGLESYRPHSCSDYACEACGHYLDSEDVFGEEPRGYYYSGEGYELSDCLDSDIFVLVSPYYTFAQFCSPCVPGAGNLDNAMEDGVKTYCLGHDWFEDGRAPYPVFRVDTGARVEPATRA